MKSCAVLAVVALATLTGCVSYYTETETQALVNPAAGTNPVYRTEWDIKTNKVSADGSARILFWIFTSGEPKYADIPCHSGFFPTDRAVYKAKAAATYTACTNSKSDALLGAIYNYKITNYFFTSTVELAARGITLVNGLATELLTVQEMAGFQMILAKVCPTCEALLKARANTPYWTCIG